MRNLEEKSGGIACRINGGEPGEVLGQREALKEIRGRAGTEEN